MRTTVNIHDQLLAAAKQRARERGVTLGDVIDAALQRELAGDPHDNGRERPPIPVFTGGTGPRAGIDLTSNRALLEALDDDVPLDKLR